jgi:hypothetical protein
VKKRGLDLGHKLCEKDGYFLTWYTNYVNKRGLDLGHEVSEKDGA